MEILSILSVFFVALASISSAEINGKDKKLLCHEECVEDGYDFGMYFFRDGKWDPNCTYMW